MASKKTLVIVESPSKCKKIEQYLGSGYKVVASFGHFTKLNSHWTNFIWYFSNRLQGRQGKSIKNNQRRNQKMQGRYPGDGWRPWRGGHCLGLCVCFCKLDLQKTKKMVFQEITKPALLHALEHLGHVNMNRVRSQQARQILDIYLGYTISPVLWKYVQHTLSAGRCQTPALRLVYENQQEIDSLSPRNTLHCESTIHG